MGFQAHNDNISPGGHEFGVQGWTWGDPKPKSITFFLDNTAMVCDQYGRQIRRAITNGVELRFADAPPEANREGDVYPRPQYATHKQVLDALAKEGINWTTYEVRSISSGNQRSVQGGLTREAATKMQADLLARNYHEVTVAREIVCAGWPQLPYEELKKLPELPPTPTDSLQKILDPKIRRDALKLRAEMDEAREKELVGE